MLWILRVTCVSSILNCYHTYSNQFHVTIMVVSWKYYALLTRIAALSYTSEIRKIYKILIFQKLFSS